MKEDKNNHRQSQSLLRYAGLATQWLVMLGVAVWLGINLDKWIGWKVSCIFGVLTANCLTPVTLEDYKRIQQTEKMTKFTLIIIFTFLVLSAVFYGLNQYDPIYEFSVLMTGNAVMAILSLVSFHIVRRTMNERPQAFVRGVYGATFLKLLVCMSSILMFALWNRQHIHKPSLFILFGIYAVYTAVETWLLSKLAKEAK